MLRKYWRENYPLIGAALALLLIALLALVGEYNANQSNQEDRPHNAANQEIDRTDPVFPLQTPSDAEQVYEQPEWWERDDLEAQQQMAWWTRAVGVITAIGVVIAVVGLWYIAQTFRATRETLAETRDLAYRQLRAYVGVDRVEITLDHGASRYVVGVTADALIKNSGNTPAKLVSYSLEFWIVLPGLKWQKRLLATRTTEVDQYILPGGEITAVMDCMAERDDFYKGESKRNAPFFDLWISVTYRDYKDKESFDEKFFFASTRYAVEDGKRVTFRLTQRAGPHH